MRIPIPAFLVTAVVLLVRGPAVATEFGGMVLGPEESVHGVLGSLRGAEGVRWIRSTSPRGAEFGFEALGDVQSLMPRGARPADRLPDDLREVYLAAREGAQRGAATVWEVWNEPDFHFVSDSAADMAAVLKAAWWGVKSVRPQTRVLMPSLAFRPGRYAVELAHNGLASWTDAYNLHFYGWAGDYRRVLAQHRVFREAAGMPAPWWVTEIGYFQLPASTAEDPEALARQSAFHERVMVESVVEGVATHLAFSFSPAREGAWDLGLTETSGRWRPALGTMTRLAVRLGAAHPVKRLIHRQSGECLGAALREGEGESATWWLVFWSGMRARDMELPGVKPRPGFPERHRIRVSWARGTASIRVGLDGAVSWEPEQFRELDLIPERVHHLRLEGSLPAVEGCDWWGLESRGGRGERPRVSAAWRRELAALPPRRAPSSVVLQLRPGPGFEVDKSSQTLSLPVDGVGEVELRAYQFGTQSAIGRWTLELPVGWRVEEARSGGGVGMDGELSVPAESRVGWRWRVVAPRERTTSEPGRMSVTWRGAEGTEDVVSVRLELASGESRHRQPLTWRDLKPRPGHPDAWQVFEPEPGRLQWEMVGTPGAGSDAAVRWAVPRGRHGGDAFEGELRRVQARGRVFAQLFLATSDGEIWRHDEWREIPVEGGLHLRARLRDFSPTLWSRHREFGGPRRSRVRWMILRLQGVQAADVLELRDAAWEGN